MNESKEISFLEIEPENEKTDTLINTFIGKNPLFVTLLLVGLILTGIGVFLTKSGFIGRKNEIEILNAGSESEGVKSEIVVELAGAVEKPDVYKLQTGARISDLLVMGGGLAADADRIWVEKYINKAAVLTDGQKVFIPALGQQSDGESANISSTFTGGSGSVAGANSGVYGSININTASLAELDSLPGIGQVFGQNIIEQRPYSSVEELLTKKVLRSDVYEKVKDRVTVY
jgi:competence protein ComEA